ARRDFPPRTAKARQGPRSAKGPTAGGMRGSMNGPKPGLRELLAEKRLPPTRGLEGRVRKREIEGLLLGTEDRTEPGGRRHDEARRGRCTTINDPTNDEGRRDRSVRPAFRTHDPSSPRPQARPSRGPHRPPCGRRRLLGRARAGRLLAAVGAPGEVPGRPGARW